MTGPQYTLKPLWCSPRRRRSTSRSPGEHVFDDSIRDLAFGFEHFKDLITEEVLQISWFWTLTNLEYAITGKTTVCDNGMQMGIEILKLTLRVVGLRAGGQA